MQSVDSFPHNLVGQLFYGLALLLTGGVVKELVDWFRNRKKAKAEVVEISAQTVKVQAEARQVDTDTVIRASARIEELLDVNGALRDELVESNRRLDNAEFELRQAKFERAQLETRLKLQEHMVERLQAANKLGVRLSELPPDHGA